MNKYTITKTEAKVLLAYKLRVLKSNSLSISYQTIANDLGLDKSIVSKCVKNLLQIGLFYKIDGCTYIADFNFDDPKLEQIIETIKTNSIGENILNKYTITKTEAKVLLTYKKHMQNNHISISQSTIAEELGLSKSTVSKCIKKLFQVGLFYKIDGCTYLNDFYFEDTKLEQLREAVIINSRK